MNSEEVQIEPNKVLGDNERLFNKAFSDVVREFGGQELESTIWGEPRAQKIVSALLGAMRQVQRDEAYWRGASALFLSTFSGWGDVVISEHEEFVRWAGAHSDIKAVIVTAIERGTHDIEALRFLVDEDSSHNAIKNGAL